MNGTPIPLFVLLACLMAVGPADAQRLKDIATIQDVRENQLKGLGLVIGLAGTGDSGSSLTRRPLANLLGRMNLKIAEKQLKSKNVAVVMVTAKLPPFAKSGKKIDVTVSSIGDAKSLLGGTLLSTYLYGPGWRDQTVYAVGQGALSVSRTHTTVASVPNGALIEQDIDGKLGRDGKIVVLLDRPDFTTAQVVANNINQEPDLRGRAFWEERAKLQRMGKALKDPEPVAKAVDGGTVEVKITSPFRSSIVAFIAILEQIAVTVHTDARIVINERTGTVIINADVRVQPVAIVHPNVTLTVPPPDGPPQTVVPFGVSPSTPLQEVIDGLNALRVTPKDLIDIIKALKAAGAIQAKVEIR